MKDIKMMVATPVETKMVRIYADEQLRLHVELRDLTEDELEDDEVKAAISKHWRDTYGSLQ